ncbi:GNAT family N-acetyltransferase [Micromonospora sp. D93]|uniref:GNAT family N-acetyltransferase n=1 Tax=Micromonospora sp. D93 TaxID=2824886 RepID=UPI001B372DE7|nr:GNAT family N-acetyltransferase [Micromonospora sp. D93]
MPLLVFRATTSVDATALLRAIQTNSDFLEPWVTTPQRVTDIATARTCVTEKLQDGGAARYAAFHADDLAGSAKIIDYGLDESYELGFWCTRAWSRRGVGRWMVCNAISKAFELGASRVILRHASTNVPSARLIQGVGARREGVSRGTAQLGTRTDDVVTYGICREEWPTIGALDWCSPCREF